MIIVAAGDSSEASKMNADYICTGDHDHLVLQKAFDALPPSGGEIVLLSGTYYLDGLLSPPAHTSITGEGYDRTFIETRGSGNHQIKISEENVTLQNLHIRGNLSRFQPDRSVVEIWASHTTLIDIHATSNSYNHAVIGVWTTDTWGYNIHNLEFTRVIIPSADAYGFMFSGRNSLTYNTLENIRLTDCVANNCRPEFRDGAWYPNEWVVGFLLAENNNIQDLIVERCHAEGNWESGFHFESDQKTANIRMIDCVSKNNAQKGVQTNDPVTFGRGFVLPPGAHLINCISENNLIGFGSNLGGFHLENCRDTGSFIGYLFRNLADPKGVLIESSAAIDTRHDGMRFVDGVMNQVIVDDMTITSKDGNTSRGIHISADVYDSYNIFIQNSLISGYLIGVSNEYINDPLKVRNITVIGAEINFINCEFI